ncbi:hypothetical protein GGF42_003290 [Coemansia sp. RSA 2424]|nr:hypothetical protein GGF42_003290 [Coemansia sp. RSA 2424]
MNHFFYDFTKSGSVDITDNNTTVTVSSVKHNENVCICHSCKTIRANKEKEEMMRYWKFHVAHAPPPPPPTSCCKCCHH